MVDLKGQYQKLKSEIDEAVSAVITSSAFINGPQVKEFQKSLEDYLEVKHVIPCANGTDALQIALMALGLKPGDEVIVPAFTFIATAEVIGLLQLKPIMVDVDPNTFNVTAEIIEKAITPKTKAVVPVHLFGQCADMEPIMEVAERHGIFVVEDNAQAIGADYAYGNNSIQKAGTIGHIGCTSFYPAKNLGAYGDGGAIFTNDDELAQEIRMIANHGQNKRYYHARIGVNSRLDSMQAAILNIKLKHLDAYASARQKAAAFYDEAFKGWESITPPTRQSNSTHVFHQYTLLVKNGKRDELQKHLSERGIPSMIYYPVPLNEQVAFQSFIDDALELQNTLYLCDSVLSLPIHTEMTEEMLEYIVGGVRSFFENC
ncbi:MAG: DegT/DnrJ/EryC1/StrS family aminotransferase [Bacteroidetes bacterium]|nr:DegT/DnrJ/EryC1/StrS family aminotransferase [Bacteroidota bacterium]